MPSLSMNLTCPTSTSYYCHLSSHYLKKKKRSKNPNYLIGGFREALYICGDTAGIVVCRALAVHMSAKNSHLLTQHHGTHGLSPDAVVPKQTVPHWNLLRIENQTGWFYRLQGIKQKDYPNSTSIQSSPCDAGFCNENAVAREGVNREAPDSSRHTQKKRSARWATESRHSEEKATVMVHTR